MNSRPKIWVTQSLPRAQDTAKDYADLGLEPIVSPVLIPTPITLAPPSPEPQTLLIFTSRNGVRAFADMSKGRANPVICVGDATAELAKSVGFVHISSAGGDARDVVKLVRKKVPRTQSIRHCCGQHVKGRIAEQLKETGYNIERVVYYVASPVTETEVDVTDINYVALYSPRGAASFVNLVTSKAVSHLIALSISPATDKALEPLDLRSRLIADRPDQNAMIAALRSHISG